MLEPLIMISKVFTAKLLGVRIYSISNMSCVTSWIVQYLFFLNTKFQASSHLQWLYSLVCVRPGQNPSCLFSYAVAHFICMLSGAAAV